MKRSEYLWFPDDFKRYGNQTLVWRELKNYQVFILRSELNFKIFCSSLKCSEAYSEQRAKSNEQRTKSNEQRAKSSEQQAKKSNEQ